MAETIRGGLSAQAGPRQESEWEKIGDHSGSPLQKPIKKEANKVTEALVGGLPFLKRTVRGKSPL